MRREEAQSLLYSNLPYRRGYVYFVRCTRLRECVSRFLHARDFYTPFARGSRVYRITRSPLDLLLLLLFLFSSVEKLSLGGIFFAKLSLENFSGLK